MDQETAIECYKRVIDKLKHKLLKAQIENQDLKRDIETLELALEDQGRENVNI